MRKQIIQQIVNDRPDAKLVKNKYKVLIGVIKRIYPEHYEKIPRQVWEDIAFDLVNGDRDLRLATEGMDKEEKTRLEQQYIVNNLL